MSAPPDTRPAAFRRILVATDFTPASEPAFARALRLAREHGATLLVAHAYQERALPGVGYAAATSFEAWDQAFREAARRQLEPLLARAREAGVAAEALLLEGFPDEALVAAAARQEADLIVLGTHGRRGAARVFLGSVAERVVGTAPCPVLTVRAGATP